MGGPCDVSVSPSPFGLDFGTLDFGWMSQGGHSEALLLLALFYQSSPSCLKVMCPCDFSVSPNPFGLDFGTLDFGLELENSRIFPLNC